jgi:hypothetical protein
MYYIGLDVHKRTISYCVKDAAGHCGHLRDKRTCEPRRTHHDPKEEGALMANNLVVILDNGGCITVQCDDYVHNYADVH